MKQKSIVQERTELANPIWVELLLQLSNETKKTNLKREHAITSENH